MEIISFIPATASVFSNKLSKVGPTGSVRALSQLSLRTASARLSTFQRWEQSQNSPTPQVCLNINNITSTAVIPDQGTITVWELYYNILSTFLLFLFLIGVIVGRFYLPWSGRSHPMFHLFCCPFAMASWTRSWFWTSQTLPELRFRFEQRARIEKLSHTSKLFAQ